MLYRTCKYRMKTVYHAADVRAQARGHGSKRFDGILGRCGSIFGHYDFMADPCTLCHAFTTAREAWLPAKPGTAIPGYLQQASPSP